MRKVLVQNLSEYFQGDKNKIFDFLDKFQKIEYERMKSHNNSEDKLPQDTECFHNAKMLLLKFGAERYVLGVYRYNGQDLEHAWNRLDDGSYLDIDPNLGMNRGDHFVRYELSKEHFIELLRRKYPNDFSEIFNGNKPFRDINIKDVEKYLPEIKEVF